MRPEWGRQESIQKFDGEVVLPHINTSVQKSEIRNTRGCIQKFPDWVNNEIITINTCWEATQRVMAAKLTRLTHKIAIQLHLVAESCTICSSRSRSPVRKLLDTPSYYWDSLTFWMSVFVWPLPGDAHSYVSIFSKIPKSKLHKWIILPVILYGGDIRSLILGTEQKLKVSENKMHGKRFGFNKDE
jgi:hypothetical protein